MSTGSALPRGDEQYRAVVDRLKQVVFQTDARGTWTFLNAAWTEITGFGVEETLGTNFLRYVHPEDRRRHAEIFQPLAESRTDYFGHQARYLTKAGGFRWVEVFAQLLLDTDGTVLGISGTLTDITDLRQAEEERARLSSAVEQAAESIVITDPEGVLVYVNPAFERVTGYGRDEVLGRNFRSLEGDGQDAVHRQMWATLERGDSWSGCLATRRKDGTALVQEAAISPVRDATGRAVDYVGVMRDVTYERQIEEQLRQAQKMEAVGRLAGGVAHDFNNILTVITGRCHLLLRRETENVPLRRELDVIFSAANRAAGLTRQLLIFSRKEVIEPRVLDLGALVANLEKMLARLIGEDIETTIVQEPDLGHVKADPGQLEQVVMNLAVNARDAMPTGGGLTIATANVLVDEADARRRAGLAPGAYVMLSVADTGCGIAPDVLPRIFEPFFTTKGPEKGTGLGLATVYGIITQGGGDVWAESEPGRGTTFRVLLPRVDEPLDQAESLGARPGALGGSETILFAEDEEEVRALAREILRINGYTVLEARHGRDALELASRHPGPIDLLLTDVVMPQMGGPELARRLLHDHPDLKVLYVSGYTDDEVLSHGVAQGSVAFLQKPFTAAALLRKIREVLDAPPAREGPPS
jgi:PAS domain S-box-containing protein